MSNRSTEEIDIDISDQRWGSDFIVDLLNAYGFDFVSFNPGASFRGLEESIVNYSDNDPTVIETTHEGLSVSIAHGYAKATDEPALCILHDVVGTMHGSMSLFNAYCDRVPVLALSGTGPMRKSKRRPWIEWIHTALDQGNLVREYVKWDDQPTHIDGVAESIIRAYNVAATDPKGPTYVTLDHDVQECELDEPIALPDLDTYAPPTPMHPDPDAIERAADILTDADFPVIIPDRYGNTPEDVEALTTLAERLGAAVVDPRKRRYNFPNTHPLSVDGDGIADRVDTVLALDVMSMEHSLAEAFGDSVDGDDLDIVDIGFHDLELSSLIADYCRLYETAIDILGNTHSAVVKLTEAIEDRLSDVSGIETRRDEISAVHHEQRQTWGEIAEEEMEEGPIAISRVTSELGEVIEDKELVLVNGTLRDWTHRLWDIDDFNAYIGGKSGGGGVGYGIGGAIGGALAYADSDRIPINLQSDGDLMFYPGALWTIGHYELPMLTVVHNNQSFYNSTNHRMELAKFRGRDASYEKALIGTGLWEPTPDYARIAEAMDVNGYGPIEHPDELASALRQAWDDVTSGTPALVDVISQPR
jgi:acetolactate synthase-1/2/3 large subunit